MLTILQQPQHLPSTAPGGFLSDSRADRALTERLKHDLEQAGHACGLDTTDMPGGEVWIKAIADGLERAYAFVPLVTEAAIRREWVGLEFLQAKQLGNTIILLQVGSSLLPWHMVDRQAIPIEPDYQAGLSRLLASLSNNPVHPLDTHRIQQWQAEMACLRRLLLGEFGAHLQLLLKTHRGCRCWMA